MMRCSRLSAPRHHGPQILVCQLVHCAGNPGQHPLAGCSNSMPPAGRGHAHGSPVFFLQARSCPRYAPNSAARPAGLPLCSAGWLSAVAAQVFRRKLMCKALFNAAIRFIHNSAVVITAPMGIMPPPAIWPGINIRSTFMLTGKHFARPAQSV